MGESGVHLNSRVGIPKSWILGEWDGIPSGATTTVHCSYPSSATHHIAPAYTANGTQHQEGRRNSTYSGWGSHRASFLYSRYGGPRPCQSPSRRPVRPCTPPVSQYCLSSSQSESGSRRRRCHHRVFQITPSTSKSHQTIKKVFCPHYAIAVDFYG